MSDQPPLVAIDVDAYLARIGFDGPIRHDLETLEALQRRHLTAVPFENLHVAAGVEVRTDAAWSIAKIVDQRRGGWCFENNGAFGELLVALGFGVRRLGAAVLLGGPATLIDHLALEVQLDEPWLVDVGFGDSFIRPLALNRAGRQDGGTGSYEFLPSPQGLTLTELVDGVPEARYRFKRVAHELAEFTAASDRLRSDPELHWSKAPFATRLLDDGPDRVALTEHHLKVRRGGVTETTEVDGEVWDELLLEWFDLTRPEV